MHEGTQEQDHIGKPFGQMLPVFNQQKIGSRSNKNQRYKPSFTVPE
jgi:hypothetical protein